MISNKRVSKLKRRVYEIKGNPIYSKFMVQASDALYLFEANKEVIHHKEQYTKLEKPIEGLEIVDCSNCSIDNILIAGDGKSEPIVISDDIPFAYDIAMGYLEDSKRPFKNLSREQLIEIADIE